MPDNGNVKIPGSEEKEPSRPGCYTPEPRKETASLTRKNHLTLVLFDIDGTLLLSGPVIRTTFREIFQEVCGGDAYLDGIRFAGNTDRGIFRSVMAQNGVKGDFNRKFDRFAKRFGKRMGEIYPKVEGPRLMRGVLPLLRALHRAGTALAVGTGNLEATARVKLARFGLDRYFPVGGFGDDHEKRSQVFRSAIEAARKHYGWAAGARSTWVIGDTVQDVMAAREVGARSIAVATGPVSGKDLAGSGADLILPDLSDTRRVLSILQDT